MQIVLVLVILAGLVVVTLGGMLIGSVLLGGVLAANDRARLLAPVFLVIIPASVVGASAGGVLIGYFATRANENLIFLGPIGGLVAGGAAGLFVGIAGALMWWRRMSRAKGTQVLPS